MNITWPEAIYTPNPIAEYAGNPFIEALPPILSSKAFIKATEILPPFDPEERNLPGELRRHLIKRLDTFRLCTREMVQVHRRLDVELRSAYIAKDPRRLVARQSMYDTRAWLLNQCHAVPNCQLLTGLSGAGKSTLLMSILGIYPQIIVHNSITPGIARQTQVVWLKVDCPQDAGLRGLCLAILEKIDDLLGTNYLHQWSISRCSVEAFLQGIYQITNNLHLGVLVLDELQHLRSAKAGGQERMLNFFVNLINGVGIPLVFAGTYALEGIVTDQLRNARRATGVGSSRVCRLQKDDPMWDLFIGKLWRYQWVERPIPLDKEIESTLYDCTQGVRDCVIRLFAAAQNLAIDMELECVTAQLLQEAYDRFFGPLHPAMDQLRLGTPEDDLIFDSLLTKELSQRWSPTGPLALTSPAAHDARDQRSIAKRSKPRPLDRASALPQTQLAPPLGTTDLRVDAGDIYAHLVSSKLVDQNMSSILP